MTHSEWKAWGDKYGFRLVESDEKVGAWFFVGDGLAKKGFLMPNEAAEAFNRARGVENDER